MSVLQLAEVKTHLKITVSTYDVELQRYIDSAEAVVRARVGGFTPTTYTERVSAEGDHLVLRHFPIISLTSVTPISSTALELDDLYIDQESGLVSWLGGGEFCGLFDVVYSAGYQRPPADLLHAAKEIVRHLWETEQRGPNRRAGEVADLALMSNALPMSVETVLRHYEQVGFA